MSLTQVADVAAVVCLLLGALLSVTAGIGLVRFRDILSPLHAATKPQVLGLLLCLTGVGLRLRSGTEVGMLLLIAFFQVITIPVAAHMVSRAAYRTRQVDEELLTTDELMDQLEQSEPGTRD